MTRLGNPGKQPFGPTPFGATVHGGVRFEGFAIPRAITAGWQHGTYRWPDGQFIRYTIGHTRYV